MFQAPSGCRVSGRRACLLAALAPDLLEPVIAAAARAVELVADGVLLVVVLVVPLGGPERGHRRDLGLDRLLEPLLHLGPRGLGEPLLVLVMDEDPRAVLRPVVAELEVL